eukprot:5651-Pelagococcus_subviridis.AAC.1
MPRVELAASQPPAGVPEFHPFSALFFTRSSGSTFPVRPLSTDRRRSTSYPSIFRRRKRADAAHSPSAMIGLASPSLTRGICAPARSLAALTRRRLGSA